jgi:hypothetical protein
MARVNLDALIPREDFEVSESLNPGSKKGTISIEDLKSDSFFLPLVRKPDFQRETNEWDADKIVQFIESFENGDLIPALILWRSPSGLLFVIDGSHRLSSLLAWITDDYGDGNASKSFYDSNIPEEQVSAADETRKLVRRRIGTYADLKQASVKPEKVPPEILARAKNLGALAIQLQWVEGDVKTAEKSFIKINQEAVPIDPTELKLIESRKKPNCIAARAIIRAGTGHKYWSKFPEVNQEKIQELAKEINDVLFSPKLETPVKTLDIPIGGKLYSAHTLPLVLEFVNMTNSVASDFKTTLVDDDDGSATMQMLINAKRVAQQINSMHPGSLGLHPIVYFYSQDGRHKIASFYATVSFVMELHARKKVNDFIKVRESFEKAIIENDYLVQQINRKFRLAQASYSHIRDFFFELIDQLNKDSKPEDLIAQVIQNSKFEYLTLQQDTPDVTSQDFNSQRKSAAFIRDAITRAPRCQICKGYMHKNSITIDHIQRKEEGGIGSIDNAQLAHPYCNTTFKN